MKAVAALLLVGMLIFWTELPTGSAWSCPPVHVTCAMLNPPNQCYTDRQCPRYKKCCPSFCGRKCLSRWPALPVSYALKCRTGPLDIVFVIDSSRSVRPFEFETMRRFMMDIIGSLDVGPNATRVGVIQYSSQVQNIFSLKTFFTRADMEKAINSIVPLAQGTMTGLAIQYAMNVAFTMQEGARPLHKKIPRIAIIVTDGQLQDRVAEVATRARNAGIEIYV